MVDGFRIPDAPCTITNSPTNTSQRCMHLGTANGMFELTCRSRPCFRADDPFIRFQVVPAGRNFDSSGCISKEPAAWSASTAAGTTVGTEPHYPARRPRAIQYADTGPVTGYAVYPNHSSGWPRRAGNRIRPSRQVSAYIYACVRESPSSLEILTWWDQKTMGK